MWFFVALIALIGGYFIYGTLVEKYLVLMSNAKHQPTV
jgi:carbon starvation protein CstA